MHERPHAAPSQVAVAFAGVGQGAHDAPHEVTSDLRLLASHVEELRETERGAIARELHDELGQLLTGVRMELEAVERVRARGADARAEQARLIELLDATIASTRSMLSHLRPRILDDFGLVAALDWLAADTRRRSGLDVRFRAEPDDFQVPGDVATGVFRIVLESLTNVLRHAGARSVCVDAGARSVCVDATLDDGLVATVDDDGVGLPPPEGRRAGSLGLLGMRERARRDLRDRALPHGRDAGHGAAPSAPRHLAPASGGGMIRVFLADDHAIVRDGLRRLLADTPGMELVGETARGRVVLERVVDGGWDVLVLDLSL